MLLITGGKKISDIHKSLIFVFKESILHDIVNLKSRILPTAYFVMSQVLLKRKNKTRQKKTTTKEFNYEVAQSDF